MQGYQTEQKKLVLAYLCAHQDRAFSLDELAAPMVACGVGKSTVYRLIARLVEDGRVRRYLREGGRGYTYQYFAQNDCRTHLHLRCTDCGRVVHLEKAVSAAVKETLKKDTGFLLDDEKTMLSGKCARCAARREEGGEG